MSEKTVVAGARVDDGANPDQGSAYVFTLKSTNGDPCITAATCASGLCIDNVCCNVACGGGDPGDCEACSVAAGAPADGLCAPISNGAFCANGLCLDGLCEIDTDGDGHVDVNDNCHKDANPLQTDTDNDTMGNVCDTDDDNDMIPDTMDGCPLLAGPACPCDNQTAGQACDDHSECTQNDQCDDKGVCQGMFVAICPPEESCLMNWCNPTNGICINVPRSDQTTCPGGVCKAGGCFVDASAGSSASSTGSTSGAGGAGGMYMGMGGMGGAQVGGMGGDDSASSGAPGRQGPLQFRGGGCSCNTVTNENGPFGTLVVALGVLTLRRRRPRRAFRTNHSIPSQRHKPVKNSCIFSQPVPLSRA